MITAIATAILDKFNSASGARLRSLLSGGLWFSEAPASYVYPYAVYTWDGSSVDEICGDRFNRLETANITIEIYSDNNDGGVEVFDLSEKAMALFDWCTLTYPAGQYKHISFSRQSIVNRGKLDNVWMIEIEYEALYAH